MSWGLLSFHLFLSADTLLYLYSHRTLYTLISNHSVLQSNSIKVICSDPLPASLFSPCLFISLSIFHTHTNNKHTHFFSVHGVKSQERLLLMHALSISAGASLMIFLHTCRTAQGGNKVTDCSPRVTGFIGGWDERAEGRSRFKNGSSNSKALSSQLKKMKEMLYLTRIYNLNYS